MHKARYFSLASPWRLAPLRTVMSSSRHRLPCESIHCLLLLYIKTNGGCPLPSKERLIAMKHWWKRAVYACILCLCLCCTACSANSQPDPAVLLRETLSQVNALESCESRFSNDLEFNAGTEQQTFHSAVSSVYFADPFCLKSTQDTGAGAPSVTYTTVSYTHLSSGSLPSCARCK